MSDVKIPGPRWVIELIAAIEAHEEVHPKGYKHPGATDDASGCLFGILTKIPPEARAYATGWADGYAAAQQERTEEQP